MMTYILAVFHKIFKVLERSGQARARRYLHLHRNGLGGWQ